MLDGWGLVMSRCQDWRGCWLQSASVRASFWALLSLCATHRPVRERGEGKVW